MPSVNNHELIGNLGQDAQVKSTSSGTMFVVFSMATQEWVPNGQPETEWHNISVFGRTAETLIDLIQNNGALAKGDLVRVVGSTRLHKYTKNDGTESASNRTTAREVTLLSSRREAQDTQPAYAQQYAAEPQQQYPPQQQYAPQPQYAQAPQQQYAPAPPPLPGRR